MADFYVYTYLREDGSPYYVGKGQGDRFRAVNRNHYPPKDVSRIRVYPMLDEATALAYERYFIDFWGRKDIGTGILHNLTDGGDGISGRICTDATRQKMRRSYHSHKQLASVRPTFSREQQRQFGKLGGRAAVTSGQLFRAATPESRLKGNHNRWHVSRGVVKGGCSLCSQ